VGRIVWEYLAEDVYRITTVTYPAAGSLVEKNEGLLYILELEGDTPFNVVGTMTLAFLNEIVAGRVHKAQPARRYQCVVEKFVPSSVTRIPLLIT